MDPPSLLTLTMRAWALRRSSGRKACVVRQAPSRLVSSASRTTPRSAGQGCWPGAGGPLALAGVASPGDAHDPAPGQLAGHVPADPAVGAGDHGDGALSTATAGEAWFTSRHGVTAGDSGGGRNAAKGLVTTRVRAANRYSVAGLPPTGAGRAAAAVASITPRRVSNPW